MEKVTVDKDELLTALQENREGHREIFEQALEGYRTRAIEILQGHINDIERGAVERVQVSLPRPEDHTKDYDRAIRMVEMSVDNEITLDEMDFQRYVLDDWNWKREFVATSAMYTEG